MCTVQGGIPSQRPHQHLLVIYPLPEPPQVLFGSFLHLCLETGSTMPTHLSSSTRSGHEHLRASLTLLLLSFTPWRRWLSVGVLIGLPQILITTAPSQLDGSWKDTRNSWSPRRRSQDARRQECPGAGQLNLRPTLHTKNKLVPLPDTVPSVPHSRYSGFRRESPIPTQELGQGKEPTPLDSGVGG